ncbi:unnamed protein product [Brassica oleracea]
MTIKILITKLKVNLQYFQDCKSLSILEIVYLLFLYYRLMKKNIQGFIMLQFD